MIEEKDDLLLPDSIDFLGDLNFNEPQFGGVDDVGFDNFVHEDRVRIEKKRKIETKKSGAGIYRGKRVNVDSKIELSDLDMRHMRDSLERAGSVFPSVPAFEIPGRDLESIFQFNALGITSSVTTEEWNALIQGAPESEIARTGNIAFPESPREEIPSQLARSPAQAMPWHVGPSSETEGSIKSKQRSSRSNSPGLGGIDDFGFDFSTSNQSVSGDEVTSNIDSKMVTTGLTDLLEFDLFGIGTQNEDVQEASSFLKYVKGIMNDAETDYGNFWFDSIHV